MRAQVVSCYIIPIGTTGGAYFSMEPSIILPGTCSSPVTTCTKIDDIKANVASHISSIIHLLNDFPTIINTSPILITQIKQYLFSQILKNTNKGFTIQYSTFQGPNSSFLKEILQVQVCAVWIKITFNPYVKNLRFYICFKGSLARVHTPFPCSKGYDIIM